MKATKLPPAVEPIILIDEFHMRFDMAANTLLDSRSHNDIFLELTDLISAFKYKIEVREGQEHPEEVAKHFEALLDSIKLEYLSK